jgi:hypothetical protein
VSLKDQQWDDIYKAALAMQERNKQDASTERRDDGGSTGSSSEDDDDDNELFDPLYDIPEPSSSTRDVPT